MLRPLLVVSLLLLLTLSVLCQKKSSMNFSFLSPQGVQFTISGPYKDTDTEYELTAHVSVNEALQRGQGQFNGQLSIDRGKDWSFVISKMKVKYFDIIYYSVEVKGTLGRSTWTRTISGYWQVPNQNPHGSQTSRPTQAQTQRPATVQTQRPSGTSSGWSSDGVPDPDVEYLNPRGLRVTITDSHRMSNVYLLKYHVNVNKEFGNVKSGTYNGEITIPRGRPWTFTVPNLKLEYFDIVYYWVEIQGQEDSTTWTVQYKGHWQVPDENPHESGPMAETERPSVPVTTPPRTTQQRTTTTTRRPTTTTTRRPTTTTTEKLTTTTTWRPTTTTTQPTTTTTECPRSITIYNQWKIPCVKEVIADHFEFNSIEQISGTEPEDSFMVFSKDCVVDKGFKYKSIVPMLLEDKYGKGSKDGSLFLPNCTSKNPTLCSASASNYFILPPVLSGRQTTEHSFNFRYGIIEVTAKLPSGDWVVPEIWLMPKSKIYGSKSGKIVLAKVRGNSQLFDSDGKLEYSRRILEAGVHLDSNNQLLYRIEKPRPWVDDYHTFRLEWTPNEMGFYVDDEEISIMTPGPNGLSPSLKGSKLAPFDKQFYLVYGVHVGGDADFPDTLVNKPWLNRYPKSRVDFWKSKDTWFPTWSSDTALHIRDIRVTALDY